MIAFFSGICVSMIVFVLGLDGFERDFGAERTEALSRIGLVELALFESPNL